jgi:hypothetical protein
MRHDIKSPFNICAFGAVGDGTHDDSAAIQSENCFNQGTVGSRSFGHVLFNNAPNDQDLAGVNKVGFV